MSSSPPSSSSSPSVSHLNGLMLLSFLPSTPLSPSIHLILPSLYPPPLLSYLLSSFYLSLSSFFLPSLFLSLFFPLYSPSFSPLLPSLSPTLSSLPFFLSPPLPFFLLPLLLPPFLLPPVLLPPPLLLLQATGNTDLIPWLTSYFYIYYPALIILVCIATLLSLGTRIVSLLGYQKFIGEDDFSADYIDEGKTLMKRGEDRMGRGLL